MSLDMDRIHRNRGSGSEAGMESTGETMFVNGCHIISVHSSENAEGFSSMVSRSRPKSPDGVEDEKVERGPFSTILSAQLFAHAWNDFDNPPPMPMMMKVQPESEVSETP